MTPWDLAGRSRNSLGRRPPESKRLEMAILFGLFWTRSSTVGRHSIEAYLSWKEPSPSAQYSQGEI